LIGRVLMASNPDIPSRAPQAPKLIEKLTWLQAISADHEISPMAAKLAIALATRYINNRTGVSFVGWKPLQRLLAYPAVRPRRPKAN
jgi:hypothetical protein